jgi:hypothetical protein
MPDSSVPRRTRVANTCFLLALATSQAMATAPPWLKAEMVPTQAMGAIDQMPVKGQFNATPAIYDSATQRWSFWVMPVEAPRFQVTLDETTGDVCARYPGQDYCAGLSTAKKAIDLEKAEFAKREDARTHPAPDMDGLWLSVIENAQAHSSRAATWYLSLQDNSGERIDPSPAFVARASSSTLTLLPMSALESAQNKDAVTRVIIGQPLRRPDGDYDLGYGVFMGTRFLFGSSFTLRMRHDTQGWHVVSRRTEAMM